MAEFRLGRLKFNWRGAWAPSTAFIIDDIVRYGASSYVCTGNHTSDACFYWISQRQHILGPSHGGTELCWRMDSQYRICCKRYRQGRR